MTPRVLAAVALVAALAACSSEPEPRAVDPAGSAGQDEVRTRGPVTVLDDGDGAELCLGGVAESYPPQCGGPRLLGWDWEDHPEHEQAGGVRWGGFVVTGTFDGTDLTPTEVVPEAEADDPPPDDEEPLGTPCEDAATSDGPTGPEAMDATLTAAAALPDLAMVWLDGETINVAVTGDLATAESRLRRTWGGPLCLSPAEHTERELQEIQRELQGLPGVLSSGSTRPDRLDLLVVHDDGSLQDRIDEDYGPGLVEVSSALVSASG